MDPTSAAQQSDSDVIANLNALWDWIRLLASPVVILSAIAAVWKGGGNYRSFRNELDAHRTAAEADRLRITAVEVRQDTLGRDHTSLQVAVAALPTRAELQAGFDLVRAEIRTERLSK